MGSTCNHAISIGLGQWQHICEVGGVVVAVWLGGSATHSQAHMQNIHATQKIKKGHNFALQNTQFKHITQVIVGVQGQWGWGRSGVGRGGERGGVWIVRHTPQHHFPSPAARLAELSFNNFSNHTP